MLLSPLLRWTQRTSLVTQIVIGLLIGLALAMLVPAATPSVAFLGTLFISALKAIAPVLVFVLVIAAIGNHRPGENTHMRPVLLLYVVGTLAAALVGDDAAMEAWLDITPLARNEWICLVTDAKQDKTRVRRLERTIDQLNISAAGGR